jgi:hypothetical protein
VVSDVGTMPPESWQKKAEEPWTKLALVVARDPHVLCFDYDFGSGGTFTWPKLLKKGETLLHTLLQLRKDTTVMF